MKILSFTGNFYSSAAFKASPLYELTNLNKQETALKDAFKNSGIKNVGYNLVVANYNQQTELTHFMLLKNKKKVCGDYEFLLSPFFDLDRLIKIFNDLKLKIKYEKDLKKLRLEYENKKANIWKD